MLRAVVRRRRNLRKPSRPKAKAAAASTAGNVIEVMVDRVELARPTRITPVLVTGPSLVGAITDADEADAEAAGAVEAAGEVAAAGEVGLFELLPTPIPPLVIEGAAYVCEYVCDDTALGLAGAVVGDEDSVTTWVPETVMVTEGLPGPQAALTLYGPEAEAEIVAVPVKLICVFAIDAEPPTKAAE